jgi:hypothetical protein
MAQPADPNFVVDRIKGPTFPNKHHRLRLEVVGGLRSGISHGRRPHSELGLV